MSREKWGSRASFILAAIGSAVGLGNAWRFPGQAAKYGGGTFLVVYIIALVTAGFPLLLMELSVGRRTRQGAPGAMRRLGKKLEPTGWLSVGTAFVIVCYYACVFAWVLIMSIKSFSLTTANAGTIFDNEVLQISTGPMNLGGISWLVLGGLAIAWILIYFCIRKGTKSVGKVTKFTVIIPAVLLVVMMIQGFTLDGAGSGLKELFVPKWEAFGDPDVWVGAYGQVFYSLSIMMAIMFAYGSFVDKKNDLVKDATIIVICDALTSIVAGVVVFSCVGYQAGLEGKNVVDVLANQGGIGLAFYTYPVVLMSMSSAVGLWGARIMAFIFYMSLVTLAIDSAFSIVEGVSTAVSDKFKLKKRRTTLAICIVGGIISIIFATKAGLYWVDIVDAFCNEVMLLGVGVVETIAIGWVFGSSKMFAENKDKTKKEKFMLLLKGEYGIKKVRTEFNKTSKVKIGAWYDWCVRIVAPVMFLVMFIIQIISKIKAPYGGYSQIAVVLGGWLPTALVVLASFMIPLITAKNKRISDLEKQEKSWDEIVDDNADDEEEEVVLAPVAAVAVEAQDIVIDARESEEDSKKD